MELNLRTDLISISDGIFQQHNGDRNQTQMKGIRYQLQNNTNKNNNYSSSTLILSDFKDKGMSKLNGEPVEYTLKQFYPDIKCIHNT